MTRFLSIVVASLCLLTQFTPSSSYSTTTNPSETDEREVFQLNNTFSRFVRKTGEVMDAVGRIVDVLIDHHAVTILFCAGLVLALYFALWRNDRRIERRDLSAPNEQDKMLKH